MGLNYFPLQKNKKHKVDHVSTFYDFILYSERNWVQKTLPKGFFMLFIGELEK